MPLRIILAALASVLVGCSSNADSERGVERQSGATVTVADRLRACSADTECVLVATGCDGCCQQGAVNRRFVQAFEDGFADACRSYSGPVCDCIAPPAAAQCVENLCTAVAVE